MHGWRSGVTRADASRQVFWPGIGTIVLEIVAEVNADDRSIFNN